MVNENQGSGASGTQSSSAGAEQPLTRDEVSAEIERAATDPTHPQHHGYKYQTPQFDKWADALYRRLPNMGGKIEIDKQTVLGTGIGDGITVVDESNDPVAQQAQTELKAVVNEAVALRGIDLKVVNGEANKLFGSPDGLAVYDLIDERTLAGLAPSAVPQAHIAMAQWLSDMAQLRSSATPENEDDSEPVSPMEFQGRYVEALQQRGINVQTLDKAVETLFMGRDKEYKSFVKQLDAFPPSKRLDAYVRSADAIMYWIRLKQYVA